jgi:hypothetical protein
LGALVTGVTGPTVLGGAVVGGVLTGVVVTGVVVVVVLVEGGSGASAGDTVKFDAPLWAPVASAAARKAPFGLKATGSGPNTP